MSRLNRYRYRYRLNRYYSSVDSQVANTIQSVAGGSEAQFSPQRTAWQMIYKYDRGKQLKRKQKHCKCCKWPGCFWSAAIILVLWCTVCNTQLSHATLFPLTVSLSTAVRSWPIKSQWVHYYWLLQLQEQQIVLRMQSGTPHKILYSAVMTPCGL